MPRSRRRQRRLLDVQPVLDVDAVDVLDKPHALASLGDEAQNGVAVARNADVVGVRDVAALANRRSAPAQVDVDVQQVVVHAAAVL